MKNEIVRIQNIKGKLLDHIELEMEVITDLLAMVEKPEKRLELLLKFMPYIIPSIKSMDSYNYDWHSP